MLTIPNSVTYIGDGAFYYCSGLTSVTLPNSVTSIGAQALYYCSGLTSITSLALTPPISDSQDIINDYSKVTLYVPNQAIEAYKSAEGWSEFANIVGLEHDETIGGLKYILNPANRTAVVTFAEENSLANYEGMQSVIVPETVAFDGESYTVVGIGDEAFNNCWGLKAVSLPSTLQSIGKLAFGYCTSLRSVTIPEEVTIVDNEAFTGCSALASVTIGNSVETIGDYAFFGCTGLASLHVPESV
ncbi:MAG: leucine-rich repeat domain-containing protein, partial [Muribaculaceae bacterium]|nr:leucine-rich repeat domain-containing protein [Muribaculaceae bacterium]